MYYLVFGRKGKRVINGAKWQVQSLSRATKIQNNRVWVAGLIDKCFAGDSIDDLRRHTRKTLWKNFSKVLEIRKNKLSFGEQKILVFKGRIFSLLCPWDPLAIMESIHVMNC